jgi:hypothetical protein
MWRIDKFATIFLASDVAEIAAEENTTEKQSKTTTGSIAVTFCRPNRSKETVANFNAYPASTTLPPQDAST